MKKFWENGLRNGLLCVGLGLGVWLNEGRAGEVTDSYAEYVPLTGEDPRLPIPAYTQYTEHSESPAIGDSQSAHSPSYSFSSASEGEEDSPPPLPAPLNPQPRATRQDSLCYKKFCEEWPNVPPALQPLFTYHKTPGLNGSVTQPIAHDIQLAYTGIPLTLEDFPQTITFNASDSCRYSCRYAYTRKGAYQEISIRAVRPLIVHSIQPSPYTTEIGYWVAFPKLSSANGFYISTNDEWQRIRQELLVPQQHARHDPFPQVTLAQRVMRRLYMICCCGA